MNIFRGINSYIQDHTPPESASFGIERMERYMSKATATIKTVLKPGRTLLITGPRGCGKLHCTRLALQELGMKALTIHLEHVDSFVDSYPDPVRPGATLEDPLSIRFRCKSASGNMAILFDEIETINKRPEFVAPILEVMMNPDRYVVLLGLQVPRCLPLIERCQHINMIGLSP